MADGNSQRRVHEALAKESAQCHRYYNWLEQNMPAAFFHEIREENVILIVHNLMVLHLQDYFSILHLKYVAFVLCVDSPEADVRVLSHFRNYGIKNYRTFVSAGDLPIEGHPGKLRIGAIYFTEAVETVERPIPPETIAELRTLVRARNPDLTEEQFERLVAGINTRFLGSLRLDRLVLALDMFFRAKTRDFCQYEVLFEDNWREKEISSMQIVLAWRNTQKKDFLYRVAQLVQRHGLIMKQVNATYIDPYSRNSILIMALGLHGSDGRAAWDVADIPDFLRELVTLKFFPPLAEIEATFVNSGLIRGNLGNLLNAMVYFIHQVLVHVDRHLYTLEKVVEAICRHPELTVQLCAAFETKFDPERADSSQAEAMIAELTRLVDRLDTGHQVNDLRRRNVILQGLNFIQHILKTNFYRNNKSSLSFRLDPRYLEKVPFDRKTTFPELPFAIFFIRGLHFIGFHVRFRDLARGGLRTVFPERHEDVMVELDNVFSECYHLALTQQKKNKDIPEGGAKGVILLEPSATLEPEAAILTAELRSANISPDEIEKKISHFVREQREEFLLQSQRSYIDGLLVLINCDSEGVLKAKHIVDYYRRPEYLYLGPDERMYPPMITWIAQHSKHHGYKPGISFISSKPLTGINHKEYGVTSLGVNVYMHEVLTYLGIDPAHQTFTIKMSGGPDGDVAGNQILNLYRYYPQAAKLLALTDVSGTIRDPAGLDLEALAELFHAEKPISFYPPDSLSEGGFLLDRKTKRDVSAYVQQTLCWKRKGDQLVQEWLSGSETTRLFLTNVHEVVADIFIPGGGRPRALNEHNYREFLTPEGKPTSRAIVEGANLYLTPAARRALEELGVIIIKDSSANKCGVICSSFEVLCGLVLNEQELVAHKTTLVNQILKILRQRALDEARLLLKTHRQTGGYLTDLSDKISNRINLYTDQLLAYLGPTPLPRDISHPFTRAYLAYCLPLLREEFQSRLLEEVPEVHKKAIIACHIASRLVYHRGLEWLPTIVDVLPTIWTDRDLKIF
jgi:glutamate dehydrogenase